MIKRRDTEAAAPAAVAAAAVVAEELSFERRGQRVFVNVGKFRLRTHFLICLTDRTRRTLLSAAAAEVA